MLRVATRATRRAVPLARALARAEACAERATFFAARAYATSSTVSSAPLAVPSAPYSINYHNSPDTVTEGYGFYMPTTTLIGPGALKGIAPLVAKLGLHKALIVTDPYMAKSGATKAITDVLDGIDVTAVVFDGAQPNPTDANVHDAQAVYEKEGCDFVISFGGGSSHDCAKGVILVASHEGSKIGDFEGLDKSSKPVVPLVSINTTAGTASEMTRFCIITDQARHVKMAIVDSAVTPLVAVDDPALMVGMPKGLTAATGMDALTHSIEAYVSTISNPITDASALYAMKLISGYLRTATHDGADLRARDMMSYAQYLAGMAFNSASLGYVHAMAHQLGGFYNLPHGVCNAVLLPVVQEFNASAVPYRYIDIAQAMGIEYSGDEHAAAEAVVKGIKELAADVGIPRNLKELGAKPEDFDTLATNALKDVCGLTNPRQASHEEIVALFKQAYEQ